MKTVLIITDESVESAKMADAIKAALEDNKVSIKSAANFQGTDILLADVFFLGCESPNPASFSYLTDLFKHISLAGRSCGVFSPGSEKAAKYLAGLVKDCEAALNPTHITEHNKKIAKWAKAVVSGKF